MRYWLTVVLMIFAVEAYGQDMTREVGDFIAIYTDCEYENFDQVWSWSDLGENTNYAIFQHDDDEGTAYFEIFYLSDYQVFGVRRIEDDNLSEEP